MPVPGGDAVQGSYVLRDSLQSLKRLPKNLSYVHDQDPQFYKMYAWNIGGCNDVVVDETSVLSEIPDEKHHYPSDDSGCESASIAWDRRSSLESILDTSSCSAMSDDMSSCSIASNRTLSCADGSTTLTRSTISAGDVDSSSCVGNNGGCTQQQVPVTGEQTTASASGTVISAITAAMESLSLAQPNAESSIDSDMVRSPLYCENDYESAKAAAFKRSSSLRSTASSTDASTKKAVRFADAFGFDLADVRMFMCQDKPPIIPKSATRDLKVEGGAGGQPVVATRAPRSRDVVYVTPCFAQPGGGGNFLHRVHTSCVCLESIEVSEFTVVGSVRVKNIDFHKAVLVRITYNDWVTHHDVVATYVPASSDGATDRFSFSLSLPRELQGGAKAQMAVKFDSAGQTFWDNNFGQNYIFQYLSASSWSGFY